MPSYYIAIFSVAVYASLLGIMARRRAALIQNFRQWPNHPTMFMIWVLWLIFLLALAPLSYHGEDMEVWRISIENLLRGELLPRSYVYLPIYAELLAALVWPFHLIGWDAPLLIIYAAKWFVIFSYAACAALMSRITPKHSELAPLGIVLAPVTIFYLFFGTNHIVMFFLLLSALILMKRGEWFWGGFFAAFSCYKFLMIPTVIVLFFIVVLKYGAKNSLRAWAGAAVFFIPSLIYYLYDGETLLTIITHQAAIGAHAGHIEPFHFFYLVSRNVHGFEAWYINTKIWFLLSISGIPVSLLLYRLKRLNFLQSLALSYAFVAIFALEPFRLEPLVGLLWLDAVYRENVRLQAAIVSILFIHAAAWYETANSAFLIFDPAMPHSLWLGKGLFLGAAIIVPFWMAGGEKDKRDLIFSSAI